MGIWRSTMPLLSTLAALVIIVHSAEEELSRGYRRDLRPRAVDTASYEQPWKAIDVEPVHQPTRAEAWIESPEDVPPRRRPVRKRKRRPLPYPETEPQERYQESIQGAYTGFNDQMVGAPKRRRKRPEHVNYHFTEQPPIMTQRPLRRRGLRKKRPDYDEQFADIVTPDFEPVENRQEYRTQKNNKYNEFYDDYDGTENNTEQTKASTTLDDDVIQNEYNEHLYNRTFASEERSKQTIGVSDSESISSVERKPVVNSLSHSKPKSIENVLSKEPPLHSVENYKSSPENISDIRVMIHKPKELKLGIIINGTQDSYLPLLIQPEELYNDYDDLFGTQTSKYVTNIINNTIHAKYKSKGGSKLKFLEPVPEAFVTSGLWKDYTEQIKYSSYGKKSTQKIITTDNHLTYITDYPKKRIQLEKNGKQLHKITLPIPLRKPAFPDGMSEDNKEGFRDQSHGEQFPHKIIAAGGLLKTHFWSGKTSINHQKVTNTVNLPVPALKAFLPYYMAEKNTSQIDEPMDGNKPTKNVITELMDTNKITENGENVIKGDDLWKSNSVNPVKFKHKKPANIHLSIPAQKFFLAYGISPNHTEKYKNFSHIKKPPKHYIEPFNFAKSSTDKNDNLIDLGQDDDNKLHYILFPISPTKFIAIYYRLKDDKKTTNVELNLGVSDTEQTLSLPKLDEEKYEPKVSNVSRDIPYIAKEDILGDYANEIVLLDISKGETQLTNKSGIIKYSRKHSKGGYYPKKWINTNKWISKVNFLIPIPPPEDSFEFDFMPEELEVVVHENGVIDPVMLKQLLKRSNGSSLSEMLQRHNLSLTDLLQGRDEAISALNAGATYKPQQSHDASIESNSQLNIAESKYPTRRQTSSKEAIVPKESSSEEVLKEPISNGEFETEEPVTTKDVTETQDGESKPRISAKRRFPTGIRRKLRMRPTFNSTLKAQLSRDLIALSARKYSHSNRNVTKSREWKDIVPLMPDRSKTENKTSNDEVTESAPTTTDVPDETTTALDLSNSSYSEPSQADVTNVKDNEIENAAVTTTEVTTTITIEVFPAEIMSEIEKNTPIVRPAANNSTLRRQAFNNRLKRKRLKQKTSTTENPSDDLMRNFLGMANLVSASQIIERTQKPHTTLKMETTEYATELEDFLTTQTPTVDDDDIKSTHVATSRFTTARTTKGLPQPSSTSSTEQTAKFEIQEILKDKMTKERLAKILRERNMTLNELVNHRERGSSHVHLADIFHNASKEPNPPEPFLTKSSIEPISKETYPLRAILEANTYETTTRTANSQADQKNIQIPVVMDFGNNVNENGESMGIISLFNKLAENEVTIDKAEIRKGSDGTPYVSSIVSVNATNVNDTNREGRVLGEAEDWSELLTFMKAHNISTFEEDLQTLNKGGAEKESLEDLDGEGLMILEDLQHLENFENNITPGSDEDIDIAMQDKREGLSEKPGILNKLPNNTKSVAIATASILGLGAILFLLTYIAFKWKQQRSKLRKKESFCDGPIPSPVFENRKGHKNNCSTRSISPMISNTNIYMSTLDSSGKDSPDYMWNSLRKPFQ